MLYVKVPMSDTYCSRKRTVAFNSLYHAVWCEQLCVSVCPYCFQSTRQIFVLAVNRSALIRT